MCRVISALLRVTPQNKGNGSRKDNAASEYKLPDVLAPKLADWHVTFVPAARMAAPVLSVPCSWRMRKERVRSSFPLSDKKTVKNMPSLFSLKVIWWCFQSDRREHLNNLCCYISIFGVFNIITSWSAKKKLLTRENSSLCYPLLLYFNLWHVQHYH